MKALTKDSQMESCEKMRTLCEHRTSNKEAKLLECWRNTLICVSFVHSRLATMRRSSHERRVSRWRSYDRG